jgi:hypothetical protein
VTTKLSDAYADGAAMAYRDVAKMLRFMVDNADTAFKPLMTATLLPVVEACDRKAIEVYREIERIVGERQ